MLAEVSCRSDLASGYSELTICKWLIWQRKWLLGFLMTGVNCSIENATSLPCRIDLLATVPSSFSKTDVGRYVLYLRDNL